MARLKKRNSAGLATPPAAAQPAAGHSFPSLWPLLWPYFLLAALSFAVYANSLRNGFVVDDLQQLVQNPLVRDYHHVGEIFSQDVWAFLDPNAKAQSNYYRPVQLLLYMAGIFLLRKRAPLTSYGLIFMFPPLLPVMNINGVCSNVFRIAALAWDYLRRRSENLAWAGLSGIAETPKAIEIDPAASPAYQNLGKLPDRQGLTADAIAAEERALQLDPANFTALNELGLLRLKAKDYAAAVDCFGRATKISPKYATGLMNLGIAYNGLEDGVREGV